MLGPRLVNHPLLAIFNGVDGRAAAVTVPSGSVVDLTGIKFNGDRLMEVLWQDRKLLMFTEDLKSATVPL